MIVFDKNTFGSNREVDDNGYLRVEANNITKTQVAPYLGREIPHWTDFGLEADKVYYVLRPEDELKKAVKTFNNLPLTRKHIEVDVDNVPKEDIIGSMGDSAEFSSPYIKNSLIVYDKKEIEKILSGKKRELSCGYTYTPIPESGEFDGKHYDFKMTDIVGNHVALVKEGRAGHDVMVSDTIEKVKEKIMNLFRKKEIVGDEFKESEHPRANNGQFTSKGGESSGGGYTQKSHFDNKEEWLKKYNELSKTGKLKEQDIDLKKKKSATFETGSGTITIEYEDKSIDGSEKKDVVGDAKQSEAEQEKVGVVMKEFKEGELKSGSGEKVEDPKQAIAIALSEADQVKDEIPEKQDEPEKAGDDVALNKGEKEMADEVKKTPAEEKVEEVKEEKVTEDACKAEDEEKKPACDEKEDKRKLIDEIGGILKNKLSEEDWRTVIKKAEELAYNDSERSADDEKEEDLKGKEKKAFAEGVVYGEKKEKAEPKKLDSEHESEGMKKAEEKKMAKDSALVMDADAIKAEAKAEVIADFKARETARRAVRKMVGDVDVFAFDSAEEIYKFACEKAGMDLNEIVSFKDAFKGLSLNKSKLAMDASPVSGSDVECFKDIRLAY